MGLMTALLVAGTSSTANAGFEYCFEYDGEQFCFPLPVEVIKLEIKPRPEPDPPPIYDIQTLITQFRDVLGETSDTWYMGNAASGQTFLLDLNAGQAIDLSPGAAGLPGL